MSTNQRFYLGSTSFPPRHVNANDEQYLKRAAPSLFCPLFGDTSAVQLVGPHLAGKLLWNVAEFEIINGWYPDRHEICALAVEVLYGGDQDPEKFEQRVLELIEFYVQPGQLVNS